MKETDEIKTDLNSAKEIVPPEPTIIHIQGTTTIDQVIDKIGDKAFKIAEVYFEIKNSTEKLKIEKDYELKNKQLDIQKNDAVFYKAIVVMVIVGIFTLSLMDKLNVNYVWGSMFLLLLGSNKINQHLKNNNNN